MLDEYEAIFGGGAARLIRGNILGGIIGTPVEQMPRFRDAWCEKHQNPEAAPGIATLVIAVYCHIEDVTKVGVAERVFTMRANPYYRDETHDSFGYILFRFGVPAETDTDTIGAMAARAVEPVDTDVRWATALGQTLRGQS